MGMGFSPTWLRQVSILGAVPGLMLNSRPDLWVFELSQNHFNHWYKRCSTHDWITAIPG